MLAPLLLNVQVLLQSEYIFVKKLREDKITCSLIRGDGEAMAVVEDLAFVDVANLSLCSISPPTMRCRFQFSLATKQSEDYKNRDMKSKAFMDVAAVVMQNFEKVNEIEKEEAAASLYRNAMQWTTPCQLLLAVSLSPRYELPVSKQQLYRVLSIKSAHLLTSPLLEVYNTSKEMTEVKRSANFTAKEEGVLLCLVRKYKAILENKKTDSNNNKKKLECWQAIEREFNNECGQVFRDLLKRNIKRKFNYCNKNVT
nr:unnamed protein product [Callosobruchus chinensis]